MSENEVTIKGGIRFRQDERLRECKTVLDRQDALVTTLMFIREADGDSLWLLVREDTSETQMTLSDGTTVPVREIPLADVVGARLETKIQGMRVIKTIRLEDRVMVTLEEAAKILQMNRDALYMRMYRSEQTHPGSTPFQRKGTMGKGWFEAPVEEVLTWARNGFRLPKSDDEDVATT